MFFLVTKDSPSLDVWMEKPHWFHVTVLKYCVVGTDNNLKRVTTSA